jgi:hypothetical protein
MEGLILFANDGVIVGKTVGGNCKLGENVIRTEGCVVGLGK